MPSGNFLVEKGWPRGPTRPAVADKGGGQQGGQSGAKGAPYGLGGRNGHPGNRLQ